MKELRLAAPDVPALPPQVSATFAASLVTSPAIGAYLSAQYGDSLVALVATVISVADIAFVFFVVPESLPDKMRLTSWGFPISWEQADPFAVSSETVHVCSCKDGDGLRMMSPLSAFARARGLFPVHVVCSDLSASVSNDLMGSGVSCDPQSPALVCVKSVCVLCVCL